MKNGQRPTSSIPDLEIIDLETNTAFETEESPQTEKPPHTEGSPKPRRRFPHIAIHIALLAVMIICIAVIVNRFTNWGVYVDLSEIFKDGPGTVNDTLDQIMPLMDADLNPIYQTYGEGSTILVFGNAPFADDRDSKDNLANIIQGMTDATVYNCSISGSYLAADSSELNVEEYPWDVFTFYWLCNMAVGYRSKVDGAYLRALEVLGNDAPAEAMEVYNTLKNIDMKTVDVVVAMYDASDYLAGHKTYNSEIFAELSHFTGNMEGGIQCFQVFYPNIRIIILSPTYAYGLDENGEYVSSDIQRNGLGMDPLSNYVIKQHDSCLDLNVTFVDNLYGTITEDNADDYLIDHLHLNVKGRKKVAERFIYALNYFQKSD